MLLRLLIFLYGITFKTNWISLSEMNFYVFAEKGQIGVRCYKVRGDDIIERNQMGFYTWDSMLWTSLRRLLSRSEHMIHHCRVQVTKLGLLFQWRDKGGWFSSSQLSFKFKNKDCLRVKRTEASPTITPPWNLYESTIWVITYY